MHRLFMRSLFLAFAAQSFIALNAQPKPQDQKPTHFRGSRSYNAIHTLTTIGSYAGAFVLTASTQCMASLLAFGGKAPLMTVAMKYSGLAAGVGLICATPYLTNQFLYKHKYLTKAEATYSRNELVAHGAARLFALAFMYHYGTASTNTIKITYL